MLAGGSHFLDPAAQAGFQVPDPDPIGSTVVKAIAVAGENGNPLQPLRCGNMADLVSRRVQYHGFLLRGVKVGKIPLSQAQRRVFRVQEKGKGHRCGGCKAVLGQEGQGGSLCPGENQKPVSKGVQARGIGNPRGGNLQGSIVVHLGGAACLGFFGGNRGFLCGKGLGREAPAAAPQQQAGQAYENKSKKALNPLMGARGCFPSEKRTIQSFLDIHIYCLLARV